eukprot:354187-Chlamydomonas_euryale.AAC.4
MLHATSCQIARSVEVASGPFFPSIPPTHAHTVFLLLSLFLFSWLFQLHQLPPASTGFHRLLPAFQLHRHRHRLFQFHTLSSLPPPASTGFHRLPSCTGTGTGTGFSSSTLFPRSPPHRLPPASTGFPVAPAPAPAPAFPVAPALSSLPPRARPPHTRQSHQGPLEGSGGASERTLLRPPRQTRPLHTHQSHPRILLAVAVLESAADASTHCSRSVSACARPCTENLSAENLLCGRRDVGRGGGVWGVARGVWGVGRAVWRVNCGVWGVDCGWWVEGCGTWGRGQPMCGCGGDPCTALWAAHAVVRGVGCALR